jgi:hypothetical protein
MSLKQSRCNTLTERFLVASEKRFYRRVIESGRLTLD